ncbi:MAG: LysM peptidoglycan-binding domain-containing protein [Chloroflexi bacterium]|nr:LysM peptidoglycan-binding domain-containing protein [Chloroflexota bacterium]
MHGDLNRRFPPLGRNLRISPVVTAYSVAAIIGFIVLPLLGLALSSAAESGEGYATWYGEPYDGQTMANGQTFDMNDPTTAASNQFALGTWLLVTNPSNGNSVNVEVRDRGGFSHVVDLSYAAFAALASPSAGRIFVSYEVIPGPGQSAPEPSHNPSPAEVSSGGSNQGSYTVQPGDTLWEISLRFGVSMNDIAEWNELDNPDLLQPGWVLQLTPPSADPPAAEVAADSQPSTYTVQPGDSLGLIAEQFGVSQGEIVEWNNLADPNALQPGWLLSVGPPADAGAWHVVESGDTLTSIAASHDTTAESLHSLNDLPDPDLLAVGDEIQVA